MPQGGQDEYRRDVRIVGYDDVNAANWITPSITTIRQPIANIGKTAVDLIIKQMNQESFDNGKYIKCGISGTSNHLAESAKSLIEAGIFYFFVVCQSFNMSND